MKPESLILMTKLIMFTAHFMMLMVDFTQAMVMVVVIVISFTIYQNFAKKIHCLEILLV